MGILFVFLGGGSMFSKIRTTLLSLAVIAVLIFSAIGPTIVYADDGKPPETTVPHTVDSDKESGDGDASQCDSDKGDADKDKKSKKKKNRNKDARECTSNEEAADTNGDESVSYGAATEAASDSDPAQEASAPAADTPPADLLSQVPENTSVTVLNADGQAEPLATQEAANAIASTTDPIWCPQGQ